MSTKKTNPTTDKSTATQPAANSVNLPAVANAEERLKKLEEELKKAEYRKKLVDNRNTFLHSLTNLDKVQEAITPESEFETEKALLTIKHDEGYNSSSVTIKNPVVILEFIEFLKERINRQVSGIENELLASV